ncbi:hypothetical protein Tco_0869523 [Tanacetum coccineum]
MGVHNPTAFEKELSTICIRTQKLRCYIAKYQCNLKGLGNPHRHMTPSSRVIGPRPSFVVVLSRVNPNHQNRAANTHNIFLDEGFSNFEVKYLGGLFLLIVFDNSKAANKVDAVVVRDFYKKFYNSLALTELAVLVVTELAVLVGEGELAALFARRFSNFLVQGDLAVAVKGELSILFGRRFIKFPLQGDLTDFQTKISKQRMEFIHAKQRVRRIRILEDVELDPLIWPSIEENGVTRTKKYAELSAAKKIQVDYDMKATNIILQGLPNDIYSLVNHHRVSKDLWERFQLLMHGTSLTKQEKRVSSYNNPQLQQQFPPSQYGSLHPTPPHYTSTYPYTSINSIMHPSIIQYIICSTESSNLSFIKFVYQSSQAPIQPITESPLVDSGLAVPVVSPGDDPIACLNNAMAFLTSVASLRFPLTNNQLKTSSNLRNQATIPDDRVTVQRLLNATTVKVNDIWIGNALSLSDQGMQYGIRRKQSVQTIIPNNAAFQTKDLNTYDSDCDDISNAKAVLMANILNYGSDVISEKAQRIKPTLYDGIVISDKHVAMPVIDDEETLVLEEESLSKILSKDFGKHFTPQQELSAEQAFWFRMSNPTIESSEKPPVKMEVPSELPKVSLVNASLKKLKFHISPFNSMVKKRTTPNAHAEEYFENNDLKAQLRKKDTTICKLEEIIKLLREKSKVKNVNPDKCENATIEVKLENSVANLLSENEHLCKEINHVKRVFKEQFDSIKKTRVFVITSLKNDLRKLKGKQIVDNAAQIPSATTIVPGMFKLDLDPLAPRLLQNREAHIDYLKHTQEQADILRGIVEQAKAKQPLDNVLDFSCKHAKRIQELLVYVRDTCPNAIKLSAKKVVVTPKTNVKKVRFAEPLTSSSNIKQVESSTTSDSNTPVLSSTGLKCSTSNYGSKPTGNKKNDRISQTPSRNMKNKVEAQPRKVNKKNRVVKPIHGANVTHSLLNANSELICATCKKSMSGGVHDMCVEESLKTPLFHDDPLHEFLHEDSTSQGLSSNVRPSHTPFKLIGRWTKDHLIANMIGDPSRSVSTRKQLKTDAIWCYFDAFLTSVEPKNFKQAMTEPSWIDAMQEEIREFERLKV